MKSFPQQPTEALRLRQGYGGPPRHGRGGFTLAEVLAALLMMAIIVPVALQGMSIVSRAAVLGQHKAAAMRVAERVLNEQLAVITQGQPIPTTGSGTETDGDTSYPWTMQTQPWPQDTMTEMTVRVTFTMQGNSYEMSLSTLFDPNAGTAGTATTAGRTTSR
jgi:prepilin-type N-terminal cleavage/methylation domain-containing protein